MIQHNPTTGESQDVHIYTMLLFIFSSFIFGFGFLFAIVRTSSEMHEDMDKSTPRFPSNPLRRAFCWLSISIVQGIFNVVNILTFLPLCLLSVLFTVIGPLLECLPKPTFGPLPCVDFVDSLVLGYPERFDSSMEIISDFFIVLSGHSLECRDCYLEKMGLLEAGAGTVSGEKLQKVKGWCGDDIDHETRERLEGK